MRTLDDAALDLVVQIEEFVGRGESAQDKIEALRKSLLEPSARDELLALLEPEE